MRDTTSNGNVQTMVSPDGNLKGMKAVLEEREKNTKGMRAAQVRKKLKISKTPKLYWKTLVHLLP